MVVFFGNLNFVNIEIPVITDSARSFFRFIGVYESWMKNFNIPVMVYEIMTKNVLSLIIVLSLIGIGIIVVVTLILVPSTRQKIKNKLLNMLRYNFFVRITIQMHFIIILVTGFSVLVLEKDGISNYDVITRSKLVFCCIIFALCVFSPVFTAFILLKSFKKLDEPDVIKKYGAIYLEINTNSRWAVMFYPIFLLRRVIFAIFVIYFYN
jgi:hypothetical protein